MNVSEMTPEQVRREIAERLGWVFEAFDVDTVPMFRVLNDTVGYSASTLPIAMEFARIPDWPHDAAAALELCLEIANNYGWRLIIIPDDSMCFDVVDYYDGKIKNVYTLNTIGNTDTPALALARLALLALREQEGRGVSA